MILSEPLWLQPHIEIEPNPDLLDLLLSENYPFTIVADTYYIQRMNH